MKRAGLRIAAGLLLISGMLAAKDIYVNNRDGSDAAAGDSESAALLTIAKARTLAAAGDTIHLADTGKVYRESFSFTQSAGRADARLTVDGHGATISGADPLNEADWQPVGPGLYKNGTIYDQYKFNKEVIWRYFFVFDGKMNRMGTCLKGKSAPLKEPPALQEAEWTFVAAEKAFYLKIDPAKKLADYRIEIPVRANGVSIHHTADFVTIKNLTATHVYNDGYGLSGEGKNLRLENIRAVDCGDDGISAHAGSGAKIKGFYSSGNGTGICDTGNSETFYEDVLIENIVGVDLYFLLERSGKSAHGIKNAVIIGNGGKQLVVESPKPDSEQSVELDNLLFIGRRGGDTIGRLYGNSTVTIRNSSFFNLDWSVNNTKLNLENTLLVDCGNSIVCKEGSLGTTSGNYFAIRALRSGKNAFYAAGPFAAATGDRTSSFGKIADAPATVGFSAEKISDETLKAKAQALLNQIRTQGK